MTARAACQRSIAAASSLKFTGSDLPTYPGDAQAAEQPSLRLMRAPTIRRLLSADRWGARAREAPARGRGARWARVHMTGGSPA
jgi:hypothetical protein